jgi:hypothetical protein
VAYGYPTPTRNVKSPLDKLLLRETKRSRCAFPIENAESELRILNRKTITNADIAGLFGFDGTG